MNLSKLRASSINRTKLDSTFYTDGSKTSEGVGAGFCEIKKSKSDKIKSKSDNTIFQTQAIAILKCSLFIKTLDCVVAMFSIHGQS